MIYSLLMRLYILGWLIITGPLLWAQEECVIEKPPSAPPKQRLQVVGKIIDAQTGEPLPGVLVRISSRGTYTDVNGEFALYFEQPDTLIAFLQGYRLLKLPLHRSEEELILRIAEIETELEEVQIVEEAARETEAGLFLQRLRSLENASFIRRS